jgi:hypothetical protein
LTGLLKQTRGAHDVPRKTRAPPVEKPQLGARLHRVTVASLPKENQSARRVAADPLAALVGDAEPRASLPDASLARLVEQCGSTWLVAEDVVPFLEPQSEQVAGDGISRVAGVAKPPGLLVLRMAGSEGEGCDGEEEEMTSGC